MKVVTVIYRIQDKEPKYLLKYKCNDEIYDKVNYIYILKPVLKHISVSMHYTIIGLACYSIMVHKHIIL